MFQKLLPYYQALLVDLLKVRWAIRLFCLKGFYMVKLGVLPKYFPEEVITKLYFPNGIPPESLNALLLPAILSKLCHAHNVDPTETLLYRQWLSFHNQWFEFTKHIAVISALVVLPPDQFWRGVYERLVEQHDINPRLLQFSDPATAQKVRIWVDRQLICDIDDVQLPSQETPTV